MSFADMDEKQLQEVAEIFGVDVDGVKGEKQILTTILSEGVTWEMYTDTLKEGSADNVEMNLPPEDEPEAKPELTPTTKRFNAKNAMELLKMERWNPTFTIIGYKFTREHPFVLVKPEEATWIMAHEDGFRIATPEEAEAFYKK